MISRIMGLSIVVYRGLAENDTLLEVKRRSYAEIDNARR